MEERGGCLVIMTGLDVTLTSKIMRLDGEQKDTRKKLKKCNCSVKQQWERRIQPCFAWKRACFDGLTFKNRGHWGSRKMYITSNEGQNIGSLF